MADKRSALELVRLQAERYYDSQAQMESEHTALIDFTREAREAGATQQEIADATRVDYDGAHEGDTLVRKLSRQRIAQFLAQ